MYQNVNFSRFCDSFSDSYKDNFSYKGKRALFDYLESYEEDSSGEKIELDTVALCCEYSEYDSAWDAMKEYQPYDMPTVDEVTDADGSGDDLPTITAKQEAAALEWLEERTQVISVEGGGVIIQKF